jgi:hypothetical protein
MTALPPDIEARLATIDTLEFYAAHEQPLLELIRDLAAGWRKAREELERLQERVNYLALQNASRDDQ